MNNSTACPPPREDNEGEKVAKTLFYALAIFVSLAGNTLIICLVYKKPKMRTITNYQIVNMAIADLLITATAMPATVFQIYEGNRWPFGLLLCKLFVFIQGISVSCSVFTMACIAIDRFVAILYPYKKYINQKRSNFMIGVVWFLSVLLQSPTLYAMRLSQAPDGETYCAEDWTPLFNNLSSQKIYTVVLFVSMYLLPLIVIAVLYAAISWFLWSHKTPGTRLPGKQRKAHSKAKVIKMLVIIVVVFSVCWLPTFVTQFVWFFAVPKCGVPSYLPFLGFFLSHANSAINPCIYAIFNDNYRRGFVELLVTWFVPRSLVQPSFLSGERVEMIGKNENTAAAATEGKMV